MASGCGCGSAAVIPSSEGVRVGYTPSPGQNGMYALASYPDCTIPYNGLHRQSSVFVVGLPSEPDDERIFLRSQRKEAIAYANETGLHLHPISALALCQDAMVAVFGE